MSRTREDQRNRTRIPFSATNQKLQVEYSDPEFHQKYVARWFNDQRGRVKRAEHAGYEFVEESEVIGLGGQDTQLNTDQGTKVSMVVTGPVDGNPEVRAYLMKIRKDWYDEDQNTKSQRRRHDEDEIKKGRAGGVVVENQYGDVRTSVGAD